MKSGDRVRIININNMWDNEIYLDGHGLDEKEMSSNFDRVEYFVNEDECILRTKFGNSRDKFNIQTYELVIELTDMNGNDFKCNSQAFSIEELTTFCESVTW